MAKTRFHELLERKIKEAVETRSDSLASGHAADYPVYRENVGYINGLKEALTLADDVERELD